MNYNGCTITINPCPAHGWRGWFDYEVTNGQQSIQGRSRGTKREVVSLLKWKIDHNEMFLVVKQDNKACSGRDKAAPLTQAVRRHLASREKGKNVQNY